MVIIKSVSSTNPWYVWHRNATGETILDGTNAQIGGYTAAFNDGSVYASGVRVDNSANQNGVNYVCYVFGHDTVGDGVIKCGTYSNVANGGYVDIGFEPQFLILKKISGAAPWYMFDAARGMTSSTKFLSPNTNNEELGLNGNITPTSTGFIMDTSETDIMGSGTFIYMAIKAEGA